MRRAPRWNLFYDLALLLGWKSVGLEEEEKVRRERWWLSKGKDKGMEGWMARWGQWLTEDSLTQHFLKYSTGVTLVSPDIHFLVPFSILPSSHLIVRPFFFSFFPSLYYCSFFLTKLARDLCLLLIFASSCHSISLRKRLEFLMNSSYCCSYFHLCSFFWPSYLLFYIYLLFNSSALYGITLLQKRFMFPNS